MRFAGGEFFRNRRKCGFQIRVFVLPGKRFRPVARDPVVAGAVVRFARFAFRRFVVQEQLFGGSIKRVGQHLRFGVASGLRQMLERHGERQKFAERVPAQMVFFEELLHVFGGGAARAGFKHAAAVHEWHDGEHFRTCPQFEDGEKVGQVVAQDVAGNGDGVLPVFQAFQRVAAGVNGREDADVEALGVVFFEVGFDFFEQFAVVGALCVQPENGGRLRQTRAVHGELHPVFDRCVFGLAGTPDVASVHVVRGEYVAFVVNDLHCACGGDFKGFVVRAVFFGFLRHEADVGHGAHGRGVECAVFAAKIDDGLIDAGVAAVGDDGFAVLQFAVFVPHLPGASDHRGHGGIDDDVARHVQVGDAFVAVHHGECGRLRVGVGNCLFNGFACCGIEFFQVGEQVAEAVVDVDAGFGERVAMFCKERREVGFDGMAEDDGVGDFHHRRFHVQGKEDVLRFGIGYLRFKEGYQRFFAHHGGIDDFARFQGKGFAQFAFLSVRAGEEDGDGGRFGDGYGLFGMEEIIGIHGGDVRFAVFLPRAHAVREFFREVFHGFGRTAVGIAFTQHGVDGAAFDFVVACLDVFFCRCLRVNRVIGEVVTLCLQFFDGGIQLRHGGADIGQFDDVGFGAGHEFAQFGKCVGNALVFLQIVGECGEDAPGQGYVGSLEGDTGAFAEGAHDGQQGLGGQRRCFVGVGVDDGAHEVSFGRIAMEAAHYNRWRAKNPVRIIA